MNILKSALMATLLFSAAAGAVGLPTSTAPDFSKWAGKTLKDAGVKDGDAVDLLAGKLRTPLQIQLHLSLSLEAGYLTGEKPISV
ncbi:hypothetical protein PS880_05020 [Pseudomonas fluorescens]|uniref:Uncharacterized protein n=1 Tax=Pseudomonas fluorescens TaxID=294 RepID=A0A5E7P613_PSEFL|nr:hypothetical protein PS880_05020 [Pseudomonas fluorescens]